MRLMTCLCPAIIGVDLGGGPGHVPPIIEKRPCIYYFLPPFALTIFWFAHPIFLTSLRQFTIEAGNERVLVKTGKYSLLSKQPIKRILLPTSVWSKYILSNQNCI